MNQEILAKLTKIKALAEQGVYGEQTNAEELLAKLLEKYNLREEDLLGDVVSEHEFNYWGAYGQELFYQVVYSVIGESRSISKYAHKKNCKIRFVDCTDAQAIEIQESFRFYRNHLDAGLKHYYNAFVQVEHIFPEGATCKATPEEIEDYINSEEYMIQVGMSKHERILMIED